MLARIVIAGQAISAPYIYIICFGIHFPNSRFKTSAKDSTNIDEAMTFLIGKISELQPEKSDQKAFTLGTGEVHQDNDGDSDEESKVELKNAEDSTSCCFR
jgi:hypothetical protein